MKSILVLGATGFVGRNLLPRLLRHTTNVVATYRTSQPVRSGSLVERFPGVTWIPSGADSDDGLREYAGTRSIDVIIHLAGRVNGTALEIHSGNVETTEQLLSAFDSIRPTPRIVYLSSVSAVDRLGKYGTAKRYAEDRIANWTSDFVCLRSSLIYGPYDTNNVAKLVSAVKGWPIIPVPGGRSVRLQPLYVDDLCDAICNAAFANEVTGRLVVSGPRQEALWDMLEIIQRCLSRRQPLIPIPLRPIQIASTALNRVAPWLPLPAQQISTLHAHPPWSCDEAIARLNFRPRLFSDGIRQYLRHETSHTARYKS